MRWARVFVPVAVCYVAVKIVLLTLLSLNTQYVMDEYAQAGYQLEGLDSLYTTYDPIKTVLYIYFYRFAGLVTETTADHMTIARLLTLMLALATVLLTYRTARNLGHDRVASWFSAAVLLSFSTFMERSFRTRSDSLASFFVVAAAWTATRHQRKIPGALGAGLITGLAFLCTQKSVYFLVALGLGYFAGTLVGTQRRKAWRQTILFGAGWTIVVLAYAVYFGGWDFARVLRMVFLSPLNVAMNADNFYADFGRWVKQTLSRNALVYALCFFGLGVGLWGFRSTSDRRRLLLITTALLALFIFRHNQPWPYVFVVLLPFLSLWAPDLVGRVAGVRRRDLVATVLLFLLSSSLLRNVRYLDYDNVLQNEVTTKAESLLGPGDRYCDGVWMVATRPTACGDWWDAMTIESYLQSLSTGDESRLDEIFEREPKIWILNYRLRTLWRWLGPRFLASYVKIYPNIALAGTEVRSGAVAQPFQAPWSGEYSLYGSDGRKVPTEAYSVDGRWTMGNTTLTRGRHLIASAPGTGGARRFLLPEGLDLPPSIPAPPMNLGLFGNVYAH